MIQLFAGKPVKDSTWDTRILPWALLAVRGTVMMATLLSGFATEVLRVPIKAKGAGPLFQICRDGKWGYMDRQGHTVIQPQYDEEHDFFAGLAGVRRGDRWGYINETGKTIIPFQFEDVRDFVGNLAPARSGRKWGFIDRLGLFKIIPQFQFASKFSDGLARFEVWDTILCDSEHYTRDDAPSYAFRDHNVPIPYMAGCYPQEARYGYVDTLGKIAIQPAFSIAGDFSEGFAVVGDGSPIKRGYIDRTGKVVIALQFAAALPFSEGLAAVEVPFPGSTKAKWGFVRPNGRFAIAPQFQDARSFSEGLAGVRPLHGYWGYINKDGTLVISADFTQITSFSEGLALVSGDDVQGYYINRDGVKVLAFAPFPWWEFSDGLTVAGQYDRQVYVDRAGKIVAPYNAVSAAH